MAQETYVVCVVWDKPIMYVAVLWKFDDTNEHTCSLPMFHNMWHGSYWEIIAFMSFPWSNLDAIAWRKIITCFFRCYYWFWLPNVWPYMLYFTYLLNVRCAYHEVIVYHFTVTSELSWHVQRYDLIGHYNTHLSKIILHKIWTMTSQSSEICPYGLFQ